ncbi:MAG: YncE family protein [Acidobacteria bacterium]|nr:YncE family protein [Acidobacteriota bacterium]
MLLLSLWTLGCGDVFRPIAQPIPLPSPNPAAVHFVAAVSANGGSDNGTVSRIDVSGDSLLSTVPTGLAPVHGALTPNGAKIYVANAGEDTVSANLVAGTTPPTTISLPQLCDSAGCAPSQPVFVGSTDNARMYSANFGNGTISVINTSSDVVVGTVAVDPTFAATPEPRPNRLAQPVALAETPDGTKLYSANRGTGTVTSISTVDNTVVKVISVGSSPLWVAARADGARMYVLDASGAIYVIDTSSDTVLSSSASAATGANFIFYDKVLNRLYVTNPLTSKVNIFSAATDPPQPLTGSPVVIAVAPSSSCSSPLLPTSVNVLGDGTRAYVASYQRDPSGTVCTQASVLNSGTNQVTKAVALSQSSELAQTGCAQARFRVFVASSGGGTNANFKVYVSQCDSGSVAIIDTFAENTGADPHAADVVMGTVNAPLSSFPGNPLPPPQNPVFLLAGP